MNLRFAMNDKSDLHNPTRLLLLLLINLFANSAMIHRDEFTLVLEIYRWNNIEMITNHVLLSLIGKLMDVLHDAIKHVTITIKLNSLLCMKSDSVNVLNHYEIADTICVKDKWLLQLPKDTGLPINGSCHSFTFINVQNRQIPSIIFYEQDVENICGDGSDDKELSLEEQRYGVEISSFQEKHNHRIIMPLKRGYPLENFEYISIPDRRKKRIKEDDEIPHMINDFTIINNDCSSIVPQIQRQYRSTNNNNYHGRHLSVGVVAEDGSMICFKIKYTTRLVKLMNAYAQRCGLEVTNIILTHNNQIISPHSTAITLGMADEDVILALHG